MIKKLYIILHIMLGSMLPVHAQTSTSYLIVNEQLPYYIIANITNNTITMHMIPANIIIAKQNKNTTYKLQLSTYEDIFTLIPQLQTVFPISIDHYIYLHLEHLAQDFNTPYNNTTFSTMKNLTTYFHQIKNKISLSHLMRYKHYVTSDVSIQNYFTLFHTFQNDQLHIQYAYINYIILDDEKIPLDLSFYMK